MRRSPVYSLPWIVMGTVVLGTAVGWAGPHDAFQSQPWEVMVRIGLEGDILHFPVAVDDETRAQDLSQDLPIRGTAVIFHFRHFVPDLIWEDTCVADPEGGSVAKLRLTGAGQEQVLWLSSSDVGRQSISASIGGVAIRELKCPETLTALMEAQTVGVLSLWETDANEALELPARLQHPVTLADGVSRLSVLRYVPHYTMDRQTQEVVSSSDEPVNPAVLVRLERDGRTYERWAWERFTAPPHETKAFPLHVKFINTFPGTVANKYLLVVVRDGESYVLAREGDRLRGEQAQIQRPYAFGSSDYGFTIDEVVQGVVIKNTWKNNSDRLVRPALVGTIETRDTTKEVVLEFNKPYHCKTEEGTLVLIYKKAT